jgi:hypothetical protein
MQDKKILTPGAQSGDRVLMLVDSKSQPMGIVVHRTSQIRNCQGDRAGAGFGMELGVLLVRSHFHLRPSKFKTKSG